MSKFLFIYHAPTTPAENTPSDPAEMEADMVQWMQWAGRVGDGMVDFGTPLSDGVTVTTEGTSPSTRDVVGYIIIEAADQEAALALAECHPHLNMPGWCTIEVHAAQPVPGM